MTPRTARPLPHDVRRDDHEAVDTPGRETRDNFMIVAGGGEGWRAVVLVVGFGLAIGARVAAGQPQVSRSAPAGLLFAACLALLVVLARERLTWSWPSLGLGVAGGLVLCLPVLARGMGGMGSLGAHRPGGSFLSWSLIVAVVAVAEELFLRGSLFSVLWRASGGSTWWPIAISALAFGLLHVPLYGWGALPLDLAVGVWLGVLRSLTGSVTAPAAAHVVADLAGWWLR